MFATALCVITLYESLSLLSFGINKGKSFSVNMVSGKSVITFESVRLMLRRRLIMFIDLTKAFDSVVRLFQTPSSGDLREEKPSSTGRHQLKTSSSNQEGKQSTCLTTSRLTAGQLLLQQQNLTTSPEYPMTATAEYSVDGTGKDPFATHYNNAFSMTGKSDSKNQILDLSDLILPKSLRRLKDAVDFHSLITMPKTLLNALFTLFT